VRKRRTWIVIIVMLLVAAGGGYMAYGRYYTRFFAPEQDPQEPVLETATVEQGDIVITVDGSGELVPSAELELTFRTSGVLEELLVEVGDQVEEGDLLARLETAKLERAVAEADVEVQLAQLDLTEVRAGTSEAELEDARAAVRDAQVELRLAQDAYEDTSDSRLDAMVEQAKYEFDWYVGYYWEQKGKYDEGRLSQSDHDHAMNAMISAEGRLDEATNQALAEEVQARNRVNQAQNNLVQAQKHLELLESEPLTDTLTRAILAVDEALLEHEKSLINLGAAQLYAPFDGVVIDVAATVGEQVGTSASILTLADLREPLVCFWVEETDMGGVTVGNPVNLVFEALPDDTFTGEIVRVDPLLVTVGNTPAVQAWASLDFDSQEVTLLSGMTVDVEVVAAETRNALLVPVEALHETSPGNYAVFVVGPDGELEMHAVSVGLEDPINAEILAGLELGDVVSLGEAE
jgi:HlyD family secretion protein